MKQEIGPLGPYHDAWEAAYNAKKTAIDESLPAEDRRFKVMDLCDRASMIMLEHPSRFRGAESRGIREWIGEAQRAIGY